MISKAGPTGERSLIAADRERQRNGRPLRRLSGGISFPRVAGQGVPLRGVRPSCAVCSQVPMLLRSRHLHSSPIGSAAGNPTNGPSPSPSS